MIITATEKALKHEHGSYEYFLHGLKDSASDGEQGHNVSVWEAFKFAVAGVERFYKEAGRNTTSTSDIGQWSALTRCPQGTRCPFHRTL